ncbi:MAG: FeoA family protein [Methanosarcina sp.]
MINKTLINKNLFKNPFKEKSRKQIPLKENLLKDTSLTAQPSGKPLEAGVETVTLCSMEPKKPGKISGLETKNPGILQKLMAMGILPGMPITLLKKSPSFFFEVDQTRYAVDKEIANHIYVSY